MRSTVILLCLSMCILCSDPCAHSWCAGPACAEHAGNCSGLMLNSKSEQVRPILYAKRAKVCAVGPIKFKRFHRR